MSYQRILVIQTAFLGDVILSTPLIHALKQTFPQAKLDILLIPETSIVYKHNPHINEILLYRKRKLIDKLLGFLPLLIRIRRNHYDLAVSLQTYLTSSLLMYLAGITNRLGFPRQKLVTMTIPLTKGIPVVKRNLLLMQALTDKHFDYQTELFWDKETEIKAQSYLSDISQPMIGIAPGSIWHTKRWLPDYFSELIRLLAQHNITCVLIGGKEDYELCEQIITNSQQFALNLAGKLSLLGSAVIITQLQLLVTNDSAPLHIANAVGTDVIAIFGPTVRRFGFAPFRDRDEVIELELSCRPCGKHGHMSCPQQHFRCMRDIKPGEVYQRIIKHLGLS